MVELLELEDVEVMSARAEDVGRWPEHRERYDLVVARAVAHLARAGRVLPAALPRRRTHGGAHKGEDARRGGEASAQAIAVWEGSWWASSRSCCPACPRNGTWLWCDKVRRTPTPIRGVPACRRKAALYADLVSRSACAHCRARRFFVHSVGSPRIQPSG